MSIVESVKAKIPRNNQKIGLEGKTDPESGKLNLLLKTDWFWSWFPAGLWWTVEIINFSVEIWGLPLHMD
jgi:hypothetical protein